MSLELIGLTNYLYCLFQVLGLKIIEVDDNRLTSDDMFKYAEAFKIILENKSKMKSSLYQFIIKRLIDNVLLASMPIVLINKQYSGTSITQIGLGQKQNSSYRKNCTHIFY